MHSLADARCFGYPAFAARYAELRRFAAKNSQTVENDREKFSGPVRSLRGNATALIATALIATDCGGVVAQFLARFRSVLIDLEAVNVEDVQRERYWIAFVIPAMQYA